VELYGYVEGFFCVMESGVSNVYCG
jgi:hypothetical protein